MTDRTLSPAAQAVLDAFLAEWNDCFLQQDSRCIAAALRALEGQLAQDRAAPMPLDHERAVLTERIRLFRRITAIAAELEGA